MDLVDFVHHYEDKIEEMRLAELEEDFRCKNGMPHLKVKSGIFKHAASEYTMKIFSFFEQELISFFGVRMTEFSNNGIDYIYEAFEEGCKRIFKVQFSSLTSTVSCSCKLFESMGLLCCHALKVIDSKNFTCIPKQYIMKRWTKGAKKEVVGSYDLSYSSDKEKKSAQSLRLSELLHQGNFAFSVGSLSDLGTKIIKQKLMEALKILENDEEIANVMGNLNKRDNNISSNECLVLNPSIIRAKDVTNARIKNSLENKKKKSAKVGGSSQSSRPNTMSFETPQQQHDMQKHANSSSTAVTQHQYSSNMPAARQHQQQHRGTNSNNGSTSSCNSKLKAAATSA
ncbi:protein FAR1-RELATED SEQUENCE 5-like [Ziziphus jujuba]|uniref:Protein FAR1-RELATED SEQUENCE n=1 Tax=Ziziphus jujuba TaxID=326968 RepID=A0ABM3ZXF7_ZIZJJ|nr:protein FAR1-RELATED SEQUENCE 5-like [Ziziphus jujuba]